MHPTLVRFPALALNIPSYHTLIALAALVCFVIGPRWANRLEGIDPRMTVRVLLVMGIAALVGGRLHFVINQWSLFAGRPLDVFQLWTGGIHASGAIIGLVLAALW